eukprot:Colp12_sorted_trinity150504_noHs@30917
MKSPEEVHRSYSELLGSRQALSAQVEEVHGQQRRRENIREVQTLRNKRISNTTVPTSPRSVGTPRNPNRRVSTISQIDVQRAAFTNGPQSPRGPQQQQQQQQQQQ